MSETTATGPRALAQLLADWRGDAAVLRRRGEERKAAALEEQADQVQRAAEDFLVPLNESQALIRSGWEKAKLRWWFRIWERDGYAWEDGNDRKYLRCVVPTRARRAAAADAGRLAAERYLKERKRA